MYPTDYPLFGFCGIIRAGNTDAEEDVYKLPTQTVTAQKREEVLQKVPIAVASIDSTKTEDLQIGNINEMVESLPISNLMTMVVVYIR